MEREANYRVLFENNPCPMWVYDNQSYRFLQVNDAACQQYGYSPEEFAGMTVLDIRPPEDRVELLDLLAQGRLHSGGASGIWQHRTKDHRALEVEVRRHPVVFDGHDASLILAQDVTERRHLEAALEHRAFHDSLTELPNRALFRDRVQHALDAATRAGHDVCVLLLDLDGFKMVNDSLGHAAGDDLLVRAGDRLQTCLRPGDTVARMGGDEFAILLENALEHERTALAERILESIRQPFTIEGQEIFLTASIGIVHSGPVVGGDVDRTQLLRDADLAMYEAKASGRDRCTIFEARMRLRTMDRLKLQTDLQHALDRNELHLAYQPTVDLETTQIVGFEALLRWEHPVRGPIPPVEFIPLAEETGLIVPIGQWVLKEATRQLARWQQTVAGAQHLTVAINVSGRQIQTSSLVGDVSDAIGRADIDPGTVTLEITETVLLSDSDTARDRLQALKELGVRIAIDDFGTGYSSLSYLSTFPLDIMKLDKSFLAELTDLPHRQAFLSSIIDMGHTLQLATLGEGIETVTQLTALRECGCDLGQGFLFARPLTAAQATIELTSTDHRNFAVPA